MKRCPSCDEIYDDKAEAHSCAEQPDPNPREPEPETEREPTDPRLLPAVRAIAPLLAEREYGNPHPPEGDAPDAHTMARAALEAIDGVPRTVSGTFAQNSRGEWVPAIPEPLWVGRGLRKAKCNCREVFPNGEQYRGHYALVHVLGLT